MRFSELFTKTSKTAPADADSANAQLLTRAGFVSKQMAGVYNYLPLGLRVLRRIEQVVREEMDRIGSQEILMSAMTLEESFERTGRQGMDVLYRFLGHGETKLALNPTHEEVVTPLVQGHAVSYRDLPVSVYQIQNKFRNEARAKSGILRGREFVMKDMYSFHADQADLDRYYEIAKEAYFKVYDRLGLGNGRTLLTYASGGAFSKYSHEFQTLSEVGEDTIHVCNAEHDLGYGRKGAVAINKEIMDDLAGKCPECRSADLEEKAAIEVGNIFKLGTRFSDAFGFPYAAEDGSMKPIPMGCYGIGPSRVMGVLVEAFHDERGILWPESVAPYQYHLTVLGANADVLSKAAELYEKLGADNVLFDDRDASAGEKLADADLIGIPNRILVSKKSLEAGGVEWKKRNEKEANIVPLDQVG